MINISEMTLQLMFIAIIFICAEVFLSMHAVSGATFPNHVIEGNISLFSFRTHTYCVPQHLKSF